MRDACIRSAHRPMVLSSSAPKTSAPIYTLSTKYVDLRFFLLFFVHETTRAGISDKCTKPTVSNVSTRSDKKHLRDSANRVDLRFFLLFLSTKIGRAGTSDKRTKSNRQRHQRPPGKGESTGFSKGHIFEASRVATSEKEPSTGFSKMHIHLRRQLYGNIK